MPAIETVFVDLTSIVPASWFNLLQKHLAGFLNLKVTISGDAVQVVGASHDGVASAYIGGQMRRNDSTVSHTFVAEGAGTYSVFVVATAAVDTFGLEVSLTTPATSPYRKVAEVDWDGASITALRGVRGWIIDHAHDGVAHPQIEHNNLGDLASGDPHTQYVLVDGSRAFTGPVAGVTPTAAAHLATKDYADSVLRTVPVGGIYWWPSSDPAPAGFLLAQGQAVSRATYSRLFAVVGTKYGSGDGVNTFNLPDVRGKMIAGADSQANRGVTGGSLAHTHTQPTHAHTQDAHTHTGVAHDHAGASTGSAGSHVHTQGATGSAGAHQHTQAAHQHGAVPGLSVGAWSAAVVGSRHAGSGDAGLFPEDDLDQSSSSTSHSHSDGSLVICDPTQFLTGSTSSNTASHTHGPAGNAYAHTHAAGSMSGSVASDGSGLTSSDGSHTHTNPDLASGGSHTHGMASSTDPATVGANSDGAVAAGAAGNETTGAATFPYLTAHAIIRFD